MSYTIEKIPNFKTIPIDSADFERFVPNFEIGPNVSESAKAYLAACDEKVFYLVKHGFSSVDLHRVRSTMIDQLMQKLYCYFVAELDGVTIEGASCCLAATGGYGRQEMALLSDVDLLLMYSGGLEEFCKPLIEKILYVLWDLKLDVGHAVRSVSQCKELMQEDTTVFTSMLDLRWLAGDQKLFHKMLNARNNVFKNKSFRKNFVRAKFKERVERLKKFGGSVYLLEPHVKEGQGGLRDVQLIRWLGQALGGRSDFEALQEKGVLDAKDVNSLNLCLEFLFYLRNKLHVLTKRRGDQLIFDAQITIAEHMDYQDNEGALAVEQFMQSYYAVAAEVKYQLKNVMQKVVADQKSWAVDFVGRFRDKNLDENFKVTQGKIALQNEGLFREDPRNLFKIFKHVQETRMGLHFTAKEAIAQNLFLIDDDFRKDNEVRQMFKDMMSNLDYLGKTLFAMHDVHFFDALLPEFRRVRNRMQHDVYHVYTVDTHSIFAVQELSLLATNQEYAQKFPLFKKVLGEIKRIDLLSISVLLHDIGKGEGGNHSVIGAQIANKFMRRMGYSDKDRETVEFQVLSHLLMPHLSQRRDLEDINMITEFAHAMRSLDMLNILFVLTWADIRAVSSEAWTDWKGRLLQDLYRKTRAIMESSQSSDDYVRQRVEEVREAILKRMADKIDPKRLQDFLESISARYVLAHSDDEILEHFHLFWGHDDLGLLLVDKEIQQEEASEVLLYTLANPRVIPLVTGVLLSLDINVLSMENFVLSDGHVLIKMRLQSNKLLSLQKARIIDPLKKNLHDVFRGEKNVDDLIAKRKKPSFLQKRPVQQAKTKVSIDNDVSAYYTVIDIFTHDRLGLLYDIVTLLVETGCYVDVCKVSTKVEQVVDSFYVKDIFGQKIIGKGKLNEIRQNLMGMLVPLEPEEQKGI